MKISELTREIESLRLQLAQSEGGLARSVDNFSRALEQGRAVVYRRNFDALVYEYMGDSIEAVTGYPAVEMTPAIWDGLVVGAEFKGALAGVPLEEANRRVRTGQVDRWQADVELRTRSGETRWVMDLSTVLSEPNGHCYGCLGILQDITDRKLAEKELVRTTAALQERNRELEANLALAAELQAQLIAAEKDQSIARLAAGIAHEIRNPLNILSTGLDFAMSETAAAEDSTLGIIFREMRDAIRRADSVIGTLMESASPTGLRLDPCDVNALIEASLADLTGQRETAGVALTRDLQIGPLLIKADEQKMRQVLSGLLGNAIEAMPHGGQMRVGTRREKLTGAEATREAGSRRGQKFRAGDKVVQIEVEDTGCGIPAEALPRIFDAFFTTKETGVKEGRGLGLTVCRAIIELHGGSLEIGNRTDAPGVRVLLKFNACPGVVP